MRLPDTNLDIREKYYNLSLICHDIVITLLLEFTGIISNTATPEEDGRSVEGFILASACLDALIETCLASLRDDGSDSVGGHWQKLRLDTFTTFSSLACIHLLSVVL